MLGAIAATQAQDTTRAYTVHVNGDDVSSDVHWSSLVIEDQAGKAPALTTFALRNRAIADHPGLRDQDLVYIVDHRHSDSQAMRGFIVGRQGIREPVYSELRLSVLDQSILLGNVIPNEVRPAGEGARARVLYLWGYYATALLNHDFTFVDETDSFLPAQTFAGVTLAEALDMIASQCTSSGAVTSWYLDTYGRLHWFTAETNDAPKNVTSDTPGAGEIAPMDLEIEWDSRDFASGAYVRGATPAATGWSYSEVGKGFFTHGMNRTAVYDAPDADDATMRAAAGTAFLSKVDHGKPRGSFTAISADADGWRAGQNVVVRSTHLAQSSVSYQIARVRTTVIGPHSGFHSGLRHYEIQFGKAKPWQGVRPRRALGVNVAAAARGWQ